MMSIKMICGLFALTAYLFAVECKATDIPSLPNDIIQSIKKLEITVDISIKRNLMRLAETRHQFDAVTSGNVKNAFKQMTNTVHAAQKRLRKIESAATEDVSECTKGVSKTISRIPIIPIEDMFLCMRGNEKQVIEIYKQGQKEVKNSKKIVEDIKQEVLNCETDECLNETLKKIQEQTKKLPTSITVQANNVSKKIENLQSTMIICSSDAIDLVDDKIWSIERNAETCINELINSH